MAKLAFKEKIGYALGDGAANIAWRGVSTFLFIFYTDDVYRIEVANPDGKSKGITEVLIDGNSYNSNLIPVFGDRKEHMVKVVIG